MKVSVVGGTGYGAVELIRLLQQHPFVEIEVIISHSNAGKSIHELYPHLTDVVEISLEKMDIEKISKKVELVFFATPAGVTSRLIPEFMEKDITCIDLSGDFRLKDPALYEEWYNLPPAPHDVLDQAVYGLSEIYEKEIRKAKVIANPGCFPTATLLGLYPLISDDQIDLKSIIIDAKTGVSGAGRSVGLGTHFSEVNENMKAYKLGVHQHIPEIEQVLSWESGKKVIVSFSTHLIPMTRGIMITAYAELNKKISTTELVFLYEKVYQDHPFVRIRKNGVLPMTKEVSGSNFCDIGLFSDERSGRVTVIAVIDNLVKGASGQAIQNMNLINGWDVRTGLMNLPIYP
ncbi:N-acetyl-gamma-glutamyl-phosphate reductase [Bacillaceae bacterium S4-13-56]